MVVMMVACVTKGDDELVAGFPENTDEPMILVDPVRDREGESGRDRGLVRPMRRVVVVLFHGSGLRPWMIRIRISTSATTRRR